jgi:hypothetical protein
MILQIITEMQTHFLPRLISLSVEDDLLAQYQYDLSATRCKIDPFPISVYLSCLEELQSSIKRLQENGNIYSLVDLTDLPSTADSKTIQIGRRPILSTEIYEGYELHGSYLCDVGQRAEGLAILSNGVQMIEKERAG